MTLKGRIPAILLLFLAVMVVSCKVRTPKGIITPEKMENLLYDYHEAQSIAQHSDNPKQNAEIYTEAVMRKYSVSRETFNKSMEYYSRHADMLFDIYERIEQRYENEMQAMGGNIDNAGINYSELSATGDTANIWTASTYGLLVPQPGKNLLSFRIKADSTFKPKDRFEWRFSSRFVYKEGRKTAVSVITVRYDNDSVSSINQPIYGEGDNVITLQASNLPVRQIEGFVYLDEPLAEGSQKLLFISGQKLIRFHSLEKPKRALSPADSIAHARDEAKKAMIDSIQNADKTRDSADHFRPATRGRAIPHRKR